MAHDVRRAETDQADALYAFQTVDRIGEAAPWPTLS